MDRVAEPRRPDLDRRRHQLLGGVLPVRHDPEAALRGGSERETAGVLNAIWITGILIAIEIVFNVAGTRIVAFMNDLSVWWHIGFVAAITLALFAFGSQPTHDIGFLFQVSPGTNADGVRGPRSSRFGIAGAFALSLLQSQWTYTGYDASAHVAEETVFARRASAWGVFLSVAVSAVVGYIVLVALTLKMTSPADVLANSPRRRRRPVHPRAEPRRRTGRPWRPPRRRASRSP